VNRRRGALALALLLLLAFVVTPVVVLAYTYSAPITVTESDSVTYSSFPFMADVNNTYLAANGYFTTGLDTRVLEVSNELPHMLSGDKTLFAVPIDADGQLILNYTLGDTPLTAFNIIAGYDSCVVTPDAAAMELGDIFEWEVKLNLDTSAGANKDIIYKEDAFRVYVNAASLRAAMLAGGDAEILTTTIGIAGGWQTIKVIADGGNLEIWVDGALQGTTPLLGATVPDNANIWRFNRNNTASAIEYLTLQID